MSIRHPLSCLLLPSLLLGPGACSRAPEPAAAATVAAAPAADPAAATAATVLPDESGQPVPSMLVYQCEGEARVTLANLDAEGRKIVLTLPGEAAAELTQAASTSGARYGNESLVFVGMEDRATIERGGKPLFSSCRLQSAG